MASPVPLERSHPTVLLPPCVDLCSSPTFLYFTATHTYAVEPTSFAQMLVTSGSRKTPAVRETKQVGGRVGGTI